MQKNTRKRTREGVLKDTTELSSPEDISKRGDVTLHVGKAPERERRLLVSSVLLSHASPVFAAMFGGRYVEGQDLSPTSPRVVPLPEDDADAIATVCKIIHIQVKDLHSTMTTTNLVKIAIIAHKYDCVEAVKAWSMIWVARILKEAVGATDFQRTADLQKTFLATFLLDLAPEFCEVSKSLIRDCSKLSTAPSMSNSQDFLSPQVFERVAKAQNQAQKKAWAALGPLATVAGCDVSQTDNAFYFSELRRTGLWPSDQRSVAKIQAALQQIQTPPSVVMCRSHFTHNYICRANRPNNASVLADVTLIYDTVQGMCLDCVKSFELSVRRTTCRLRCDHRMFVR